jgi:peptide/nickel transport system permease protein
LPPPARSTGSTCHYYHQFWNYLTSALSGDFGTSVLTSNPVMTRHQAGFPATIELATLGTSSAPATGIAAGRVGAVQAAAAWPTSSCG